MELGLDGTKVKILSEIKPHLKPTASGACPRCHIVKNSPTNFTAIYGGRSKAFLLSFFLLHF